MTKWSLQEDRKMLEYWNNLFETGNLGRIKFNQLGQPRITPYLRRCAKSTERVCGNPRTNEAIKLRFRKIFIDHTVTVSRKLRPLYQSVVDRMEALRLLDAGRPHPGQRRQQQFPPEEEEEEEEDSEEESSQETDPDFTPVLPPVQPMPPVVQPRRTNRIRRRSTRMEDAPHPPPPPPPPPPPTPARVAVPPPPPSMAHPNATTTPAHPRPNAILRMNGIEWELYTPRGVVNGIEFDLSY